MYSQDTEEDELMSKVCKWADGTVCLFEDMEEWLTFMSDDFEVLYMTAKELMWNGVV